MPQKINLSEKGKTWKIEAEALLLVGKSVGDKVRGVEIKPELANYEFVITGGSDTSGLPISKSVEGLGLKRILLTKGWGMHKRPRKEGKKKVQTPDGLRLRKTVRGKVLSEATSQINLNLTKAGDKPLKEIFPDQNKSKEAPAEQPQAETQPTPTPEAPTPPSEPQSTPTTEEPKKAESTPEPKGQSSDKNDNLKEDKMPEETKEKIAEEIAEEVEEEIKDDIPSSPETKTEEEKEEAAEKVAEEVKEEVEQTAEEIAEDEEQKQKT